LEPSKPHYNIYTKSFRKTFMSENRFQEITQRLKNLNTKKILLLWNYRSGELRGNPELNQLMGQKDILIFPEDVFLASENNPLKLSNDFIPKLQKLIIGEKETIKGIISVPNLSKTDSLLYYSLYRAGSSMIHGLFEFKGEKNDTDKEINYFEIKVDLWKTKKRFSSLLKALPGQMFRFSNNGILMDFYLNENGIISQTASQLIGKSIFEIFPNDVAQQLHSKIKEVIETNRVAFFECEMHHSNYPNYCEVHLAPNENNEVVCIFNDITSRKIAQNSLNLRDQILSILAFFSNRDFDEQHFETAIQDSFHQLGETLELNSIFMILNQEFHKTNRIIQWNSDKTKISDSGRKFEHLLPIHEMHQRHLQGRVWIAREATAPNFNVESFLKSNEICSLVTVPIFKLGEYFGLLGLVKTEPDHYWANAELDAFKLFTNAIGTSIGRNKYMCDLKYARQKAEESGRLKSSFLANMSHEIRTPLNSIMGFSELIGMEDISGGERKLFTALIQKNSKQLLYLINDILDLAKIESGKSTISKSIVHVNQIINETFINYLSQKPRVELKKNCPLPDEEALLYTDMMRLNQVLNNLISNALKFTSKGSIEFGYTLEKEMLRFYVKDTGIGISKENQKLIFDQFQQAEDYTTRQYGGTGLGLSICKNLINLMGGKIWVESTPGEGSTFYFTLPYEKELAAADR